VPELALDDDQRHALAGHLDGMRVAQLVWREASPHPGLAGDAARLAAGGGGRPGPPSGGAVDDAEQRSDRQLDPRLEPWFELLPGPVVHADLAAPAALAPPHQQRSASCVEVGLGERQRLWMRRPARHSTTIRPRSRRPCTVSPARRITATISPIVGGSAG
jgi:hypothetical protein